MKDAHVAADIGLLSCSITILFPLNKKKKAIVLLGLLPALICNNKYFICNYFCSRDVYQFSICPDMFDFLTVYLQDDNSSHIRC